jgi:hypothetical protein
MTLREYIDQKDITRQPIGSVILTNEDVIIASDGRVYINHFEGTEYLLIDDCPILYTGDGQGNAKRLSVFRLDKTEQKS